MAPTGNRRQLSRDWETLGRMVSSGSGGGTLGADGGGKTTLLHRLDKNFKLNAPYR